MLQKMEHKIIVSRSAFRLLIAVILQFEVENILFRYTADYLKNSTRDICRVIDDAEFNGADVNNIDINETRNMQL